MYENYEEKIGSGKFYKDMVGANNLYYSTGKFAGIEAGVGNDCIQNNSSFLYANGGDGNDIYTTSLNRVTHVFDSSGKDIVKFSESKNDINFLFQVKIDNEGNIVNDSDYDGLFVINNASFRTFKNTKNLDLIKNYLDCQGYFDTDDNIEVFQAKDGYLTRNDLNTLRQNVATWLEDNGYHSSLEAMMDVDNITAAEELLAIYQNLEWNSFQV